MSEKAVLVVEDEAITAMEIRATLNRLGYRVSGIASTEEEAISNTMKHSPDLILMDIHLKGKDDGISLADQLRTKFDIPVVYLTAFSDDDTLKRALFTQPYGYIVKPFSEQELRSMIETALYKHTLDKSLREREQWISNILTSLSDAVMTTDIHGTVTLLNPAAEALTGWISPDAQGKPLTDIFVLEDPEGNRPAEHLVDRIVRERRSWEAEGILHNQFLSGRTPFVSAQASTLKNEEGLVTGLVLIFQDISARKQTEDHLRETEATIRHMQKVEALGTLASGIAHDFNNIMTVILGFTQLGLIKVDAAHPVQDYLQLILTASNRAKELVKQILTFSRQQEQQAKPIQLREIIEEGLDLMRGMLPTTIDIQTHLSEEPGMVLADPNQIHQVFMNLCTNAEHAMRGTCGVLEIGLSPVNVDQELRKQHPNLQEGPHLCLTVKDSGPGIAPETLPRIFDPFFTTKDVGEGTGMGLAVVHGIIISHGGSISVTSQPQQGTCFKIFLPLIGPEIPQEPSSTSTSVALESATELSPKGRVLFIDDEVGLTMLGQEILQNLGYEVVTYNNSLTALNGFKADPDTFDLVITDQTMPKLSGEMLAKEIIQIRKDIPIILCTGYAPNLSPTETQSLGIRTFLTKPWTIQDLKTALAKCQQSPSTSSR